MRWHVAGGLSGYAETVWEMEQLAQAISETNAPEAVWLVEHPPLYTAGTSAKPGDLIVPGYTFDQVAQLAQDVLRK